MLKLKRVEIHGFKSFYDRTEMKFHGSGIAAIVGPNGCGKSNLSDAISWVLGEQSAKSLRGTRMEDVIFAGTRDRKPLGMASVTLTLVPEDAKPNGHSENGHHLEPITITRRLFRSGDSEYLINGRTARLRDIQDLFLGTGLGPESYAIIEQGRIGQILSNRPYDRRAVIEEAAGITKFKTRKRLAEAKLESAKENLSRVFDILEEVTRQVNSLKRQASKTKRYSELQSEATQYLRQVLAAKFRVREREAAKIAIELNLATSELQNIHAVVSEKEKQQAGVLEASYATEQELTAARKLSAELSLEAERTRGKLEYQSKQIQQIEQRLDAGHSEAESLAEQHRERAAELEQLTAELLALDQRCENARQQLDGKSAERQAAHERMADQEHGLEAARERILGLLAESGGLKNRITQVEAQLAAADRDAERARNEEQQSVNELKRIQHARMQLDERVAARQMELISLTDQRKDVEQELQNRRSKLHGLRQMLDRLQTEHSRLKARRDSLDEIIQHRSYTTETVKRLFSSGHHSEIESFQPVGVLADFLDVDPQFERAVEEFLHDELEFVIVRNWEEAERGVELTRSELNGRATFVAEHIGQDDVAPMGLPMPTLTDGTLAKLTDNLRFSNRLAELPQHLLPCIANCYVATDRALARQLAIQFPHCWFLTTDGIGYHGRAVSGGRKTGAGPLALKRELRDVSALEQAKQAEMTEAQAAFGELERSIAALTEQLEQLRAGQQSQEKEVLALDHESRMLAEELQRVASRLSHARLELERISHDRLKLHEELERDRESLAQHDRTKLDEERALEVARQQLPGLQSNLARLTEEHASLRASLASLEERGRALVAGSTRLKNQVDDFANRRAHLAHEAALLIEEKQQFLASNAELSVQCAECGHQLAESEATSERLANRETELRSCLAGLEEDLKHLRAETQTGQERKSELQVALARAESDLKHLEESCQNELQTTLEQLVEGIETIADETTLLEIDAKYAETKRKMEALGPVNPAALEEFEEASKRHEFLNTQRQDLLDSIRDTEKTIQEIDAESRKRFSEAFHAINANFRAMFQVLFGGGTGEMRLTDENNLAESGVDIVASPPGKKLQSVLLLSGGEKSLTAMALLMAIFQYTPSPFCILDEVDAPLDDPNIERMTRLLSEMAEQTQFIVITHAKRTMEAAQALYGVTMQEPGISKLVSVRFEPLPASRSAATKPVVRDLALV